MNRLLLAFIILSLCASPVISEAKSLDVFLLTDATAGMSSPITQVKATFMNTFVPSVWYAAGYPDTSVAFAAGSYKDVGDSYIYRLEQNITTDWALVMNIIQTYWSASGGDDEPEADLYALQEMATTTAWRNGSTRIVVWIVATPGHDPSNGVTEADAIAALIAVRVRVEAICVEGYNEQASRIAAATGGSSRIVNKNAFIPDMVAAVTDALNPPLSLSSGWNFVSLSAQPADNTIESVLAGFVDKVTIVWGYENQTKTWKKWTPQGTGNTLTTMQPGKGYWIYMNGTGTIATTGWTPPPSVVHLYSGWNLIGYTGENKKGATPALGTLTGNWSVVWNWESNQWTVKHRSLTTLPVPSLDTFYETKAYWIKMEGEADWAQ